MPRTKSSKKAVDSAEGIKSGTAQGADGSCRLPSGTGWTARLKGGKVVRLQWSHGVQVPLMACDYQTPIIAREYPFRPDSREDELAFGLAAALLLYVPMWRRFQCWPIIEVNGLRGHRASPEDYAVVRRLLIGFGYCEKDFEQATWAKIEMLLCEEVCLRDTAEWLREGDTTAKGSGSTSSDAIPDDDELQVLFILADRETLTKNATIEKAMRDENQPRAISTVKEIVRRLIEKKWVERPRPRAGVRLTEEGKAKVRT
jgi:hypothetical protein